jgi:hypothetical protein
MSEYDEGTFRCTICAKEFLSKDEADRHFKDTHSGEKTNVMEWNEIVYPYSYSY